MDLQSIIASLMGSSAPMPAGAPIDTGIPAGGLPGGPGLRPAEASQRALGAMPDSASVPGLPRIPKPEAEGLGIPDGASQFLKELFSAAPQRPELLPPMARGNATAMPDMPPPSAPQGVPGMTTGSMPAPATGMSNPFREGQVTPAAARGGPMPMARPAPSIPAFSTEVQKAPPAGLEGLLTQAQDFGKSPVGSALLEMLRGGMMGAAGSGTGPNGAAFRNLAGGFTTADQAAQARARAEAAQKLAAQKLGFDQTLAVRKDSRDERGANREDTKEARLAEEGKVKNQVAVERLMKLRSDGTLSVDARFKLQDQLNRYADKVNKNGLMSPAELDKALRAEQARLEDYYGVRKPAGANPAAPAAGAVQEGATATNPTTGETLTFRGGKWVK